jgi:hypothetical protein
MPHASIGSGKPYPGSQNFKNSKDLPVQADFRAWNKRHLKKSLTAGMKMPGCE